MIDVCRPPSDGVIVEETGDGKMDRGTDEIATCDFIGMCKSGNRVSARCLVALLALMCSSITHVNVNRLSILAP